MIERDKLGDTDPVRDETEVFNSVQAGAGDKQRIKIRSNWSGTRRGG